MDNTSDQPPRLKLLVVAYSCLPGMGSEPGIGWNSIKYLSQHHDVWALTRRATRHLVEEGLIDEPMDNVTWVYVDVPIIGRYWTNTNIALRLNYYLWQVGVYLAGKELHKTVNFDIIHHLTYVAYWAPSFVAQLPIPFIWGPVGGGETTPPRYYSQLTRKGQIKEYIRNLARFVSSVDPFIRQTARSATLSLGTTEQTAKTLRNLGAKNVNVQSQLTMSEDEIDSFGSLPIRQGQPVRFISIGRLLDWKGFQFGLQAFAKIADQLPESEYWIIGDGPLMSYLQDLTKSLGIEEQVSFLKQLPRDEVRDRLGECDILVHPSLHDSGGGVILEALAAGRPVVCFDWGGPGILVNDNIGIKIYPDDPESDLEKLSEALYKLATDEDLRLQMGNTARQYIKDNFLWQNRVHDLTKLYLDVLRSKSD